MMFLLRLLVVQSGMNWLLFIHIYPDPLRSISGTASLTIVLVYFGFSVLNHIGFFLNVLSTNMFSEDVPNRANTN
jgi:hypothetical protein